MDMRYEAVVIGVSTGGMNALSVIVSNLSTGFTLPVIIVQHTSPDADDFLARFLDEKCPLIVKQADEKEHISPGVIYTAPANYHLLVEENKTLSLSIDSPVNFARPAIDVLFETASEVFGKKLIGIVLTGAGRDGSMGLRKIKDEGGLAIVQDPETTESGQMPKAAINIVDVDHVLSLENIGRLLNDLGSG